MGDRVALLFVVLLAFAGCSALQPGDAGVPTGTEASEGYAALESVEGTVEYRDQSAASASMSVRLLTRPKRGMTRQEVRGPPSLAGDVTVSNGSVTWLYDASENAVTRVSLDGLTLSNTGTSEFVRRVFSNLTGSGERSVVADPPLPVGPLSARGGSGTTTADLAGPTRLAVEYLGTKTVAGRRTHGVEIDPIDATDGSLGGYVENATYWFDAEYFYPLRTTTVIAIDGDRMRTTRLYRSVTFNAGVTAATFQYDPPPDATVRTPPETRTRTFGSVAGAAANVDFDLPDPEVPSGFDLAEARVSRVENRTTVAARYTNATRELTVSVGHPSPDLRPEGESVPLGPVSATETSAFGDTVVRWACEGLGYTVRGNLSRPALREVARDVAASCSGA
jgi:outer membrane lipoprotein-sorting protein